MKCRSCGTELSGGVNFCPNCGAVTPNKVSKSGISPYDLTAVPPPTDYGSPPYGIAPQNPYEPLNPYDTPLQAPLPPPPPPLNGTNAAVDAGNASSLHLSSHDFTVDAWVKFNSLTSDFYLNDMSIVDKMFAKNGIVNSDGWRLFKQDDNHFVSCC